jgi:hypothetical protein
VARSYSLGSQQAFRSNLREMSNKINLTNRRSQALAAAHCQIAATHRYSAMPKQPRKHDFGGDPRSGRPKRDTSQLEDVSAKQRKQHAHKAPVRRAASKFRG